MFFKTVYTSLIEVKYLLSTGRGSGGRGLRLEKLNQSEDCPQGVRTDLEGDPGLGWGGGGGELCL